MVDIIFIVFIDIINTNNVNNTGGVMGLRVMLMTLHVDGQVDHVTCWWVGVG